MILNINHKTEKHIFDKSKYYYLDNFAKFQGFKSWQDVEFLKYWNIEDVAEWSDGYVSDWLNEMEQYDLDFILNKYKYLEDRYYISCVANLEYWDGRGQTTITPLKKIIDIFNYSCNFTITDIFEGKNYIKFCISHHDGNDKYYLFFNEKKYCPIIESIVNKYDTDYINSCVTIKEGLSTM